MRDELLALLEDGPHPTAELAAWLEQPSIAIAHALRALKTAGMVKRTGAAGAWALASHVGIAGRRPVIDRPTASRAILAALEGVALATEQLMAATGYSRNMLKYECAVLLKRGELQRLGNGRGSRWARAGELAPAAVVRMPRSEKQPARARRLNREELVDALLTIEEPIPGDSVCERCGHRFMRLTGHSGRFCSRTCYETPAPSDTRTITDEGVEFEATSVGAHTIGPGWPEDARGGSSLSGEHRGVKR